MKMVQQKPKKPPKLATWLLLHTLGKKEAPYILGDFEEIYSEINSESGITKATFWYWKEALKSIPHFIRNLLYWKVIMLENYVRIAFRVVQRNKIFSLINFSGLAVGMTCFILIFLWVKDELSFDKFHKNLNDLYLVGTQYPGDLQSTPTPNTPPALGPELKNKLPEVLHTVRFVNGYIDVIVEHKQNKFQEQILAADGSVFEIFTFNFQEGSAEFALNNPYSIVITEKIARKYFGQNYALGQTIRIDNKFDFTVTGVIENIPDNSTIQFNMLVPIEFFKELWELDLNLWSNYAYTTFLLLQNSTQVNTVNEKIKTVMKNANEDSEAEPFLVRFDRIHLHGMGFGEGRFQQVSIFSLIAVFILMIACINYMNLTTSRAETRSKEISVRKINGATSTDIKKQFYVESILISSISLLFAIILVWISIPTFNYLSGKNLSFNLIGNPQLIIVLVFLALFSGLFAGIYPVLYISSFNPINLLKKKFHTEIKQFHFREGLVIIQFAISICLIIGTIIIYKQIDFLNNKNLGFDRSNLLYIPLNNGIKENCESVKQEILQNHNIINATLVSFSPTGVNSSDRGFEWIGKPFELNPLVTRFCIDPDFLETFNVQMAAGQFYGEDNEGFSSDQLNKIIVNEEFARIIGDKNEVLGKGLRNQQRQFEIIGIVEDFNFKPLYQKVGPMAIYLKTEDNEKSPDRYRYLFMKVANENLSESIKYIEKVYNKYSNGSPFYVRHLSEDYKRLYANEHKEGSIATYFTLLALFISSLGLFGLANYNITRRSKEIGIRKVFGSSVQKIALLLSKKFIIWIMISNIIAWPVAYFLSSAWLERFAYRIDITFSVFLTASLLVLLVGIASITYKSFKAATSNPIEALKAE